MASSPHSENSLPEPKSKGKSVSYNAMPGWFLPVAASLFIASGSLFTALKCGVMPDLSEIQKTITRTMTRSVSSQFQTQPDSGIRLRLTQSAETGSHSSIGSGSVSRPFPLLIPNFIPGSTELDRTLFLLAALCALSGFLTLVGRDKRLLMSSDGLQFPKAMLPELQLRGKRTWQDVSAIDVQNEKGSGKGKQLRLFFSSGGKATINLASLKDSDAQVFFESIDQWANHCACSPQVVALRHELEKQGRLLQGGSFTALWEEQLAGHFAATNFVALSPGKMLQDSRFKIVMHLSSGGLSAVYLAEKDQKVVIIKESAVPLTADHANREKARELFRREADMLLALKHDRIARVLDYFVENDRDYLVLEYVPGISLREYVRRNGPLPEKTVIQWGQQIAQILVYLHDRNPPVIHRDLTPDNLILTPDGKLFLIDFGAANQFVGQATGTIVGKQLYIAPEQFRGRAEPRSDIYALGATLHYLVTGCDPEALSQSNPQLVNSKVSPDFSNLVAQCTAMETGDRTGSAGELASALLLLSGSSDPSPISEESGESGESGPQNQEGTTLKIPSYEER